MVANHPQPLSQFGIAGETGPAVAISAQVFGREKAGRANGAHGSRLFPSAIGGLPARPDGLRSVLDQREAIGFRQRAQAGHVRTLSIQVNGQDGFGLGRDGLGHSRGVEGEGAGVHIHHDRRDAQQVQDLHRGDEGEGWGDDFISRTDAQGHEDGLQGIRSIGARNDVDRVRFGAAEPIGQVGREVLHGWSVDELARPHDVQDRSVDLVLNAGVLPAYVHHVQLHAPRWVENAAKINRDPTPRRPQIAKARRIRLR